MHWNVVTNIMTADSNNSTDLSDQDFINDLWIVVPASEVIIKTSVCIPVVLWGIIGNALLLHIIVTNPHLHTPTNLLIGNMAVADLITLLIQPWVFLIYDFFQNYQLGKLGCKGEGALECAVLLASVTNLVAISYDRLNAIVLPQENRLSTRGAKVIIAVAWISGAAFAAPLGIYRNYRERQWRDFLEKYCTEHVTITNIYWHVVITMVVWFPLGIMIVCYVTLFLKLKHYEEVVLRRVKSINVSYKKKVAQMMFVIVITFMVCRLPLTALIFYRNQLLKRNRISSNQQVQNQVNGAYHILWFISRYMILVNAAINPVIYGLTNEKFRRAFKGTAAARWLLVLDSSHTNLISREPKKQKQHNTTEATSNKINIFHIFKGRFQRNRQINNHDTTVTDNGSNVQIIK